MKKIFRTDRFLKAIILVKVCYVIIKHKNNEGSNYV